MLFLRGCSTGGIPRSWIWCNIGPLNGLLYHCCRVFVKCVKKKEATHLFLLALNMSSCFCHDYNSNGRTRLGKAAAWWQGDVLFTNLERARKMDSSHLASLQQQQQQQQHSSTVQMTVRMTAFPKKNGSIHKCWVRKRVSELSRAYRLYFSPFIYRLCGLGTVSVITARFSNSALWWVHQPLI